MMNMEKRRETALEQIRAIDVKVRLREVAFDNKMPSIEDPDGPLSIEVNAEWLAWILEYLAEGK